MSYVIYKTNGAVLATILDGTTTESTGLKLIGKNYTNYGAIQNDNFVKLLENFAAPTPPGQSVGTTPIAGTLWWDTSINRMHVYDGANWLPVSEQISSATAPTVVKTGDQWWDTTNGQLKVYNGSSWTLIGPGNSLSQGKSGIFIESVTDINSVIHQVSSTYSNGNLVSVFSDTTSTIVLAPGNAYYNAGIQSIAPGITVANVAYLAGTANNAITLNNITSSQFARTDISNSMSAPLTLNANLLFGSNATVFTSGLNIGVKNLNTGGNINFYTSSGNTVSINGNTGAISSSSSPTSNYHLTNKFYVDNAIGGANSTLSTINQQVNQALQTAINNFNSNIQQTANNAAAQLAANTVPIVQSLLQLYNWFYSNVSLIENQISFVNANITAANTAISGAASLSAPGFIGIPTAPQTPEYVAYATTLGQPANPPYSLTLSHSVSVNSNDYIDVIDYSGNQLTRFSIPSGQTGSVITPAVVIAGTATQGIPNYIHINGNPVTPATSLVYAIYQGVALPNSSYTLGDNSGNVATTAYVDSTVNKLYGLVNTQILTANAAVTASISNSTTGYAPIASPVFTGTPKSVTPPVGDNSKNIATTEFVHSAVATAAAGINFSGIPSINVGLSGPPAGAINGKAPQSGDLWFQVG
jgi:hypothetical protein